MRNHTVTNCFGVWAAVLLVASIGASARADIPAHPGELEFPALAFTPPDAADFRHELPGGVPVFLAPSHEFPLITITLTFRGGGYLEGPDEVGLGSALGSMMRRGGTSSVSAREMDERLDFLAANASTTVGPEQTQASLNCLKSNLGAAFTIFMDMVRNPGFDEERLRIHKEQVVEQLRQRNDSPMTVGMMTVGTLLFGPDHYAGRQPTTITVEAITPDRLRSLHARIVHPGNLFITVTGDFQPDEMLDRLARAIAHWPRGPAAGTPAAPRQVLEPGLYHTPTAQADLPQGTGLILTRSLTRDDPDTIPLMMANQILGGGGFTSRITARVRGEEGLAYTAASFFQPQVYYPGIFGAFFQSSNPTVALATRIVLEEIERMSAEPVGAEELEVAKNAYIEQFPQRFASKEAVLAVFVNDEMTGRDPDFWHTCRDRVRSVAAEDLRRVSVEYLDPSRMAILVIGNWDAIYGGDYEGRANMSEFFGGNVTHLPLRDPLTLEPIE